MPKCAVSGCEEQLWSCEYCSKHRCQMRGCDKPKKGIGNFCVEHGCRIQECADANAGFGNIYCYTHWYIIKTRKSDDILWKRPYGTPIAISNYRSQKSLYN